VFFAPSIHSDVRNALSSSAQVDFCWGLEKLSTYKELISKSIVQFFNNTVFILPKYQKCAFYEVHTLINKLHNVMNLFSIFMLSITINMATSRVLLILI